MHVQVKELLLSTDEGNVIAVTRFFSQTNSTHAIIISSATGVVQQYYSKFATYCASKGLTVYSFDYSGIGQSNASIKAIKKHTGNLTSWGKQDQSAVVRLAKEENPNAKLTLITHSIGGQLVGFNTNHHLLDKIIMVASQTGYWKTFKGLHGLKMWLFWYVIAPLFTTLFGYFPAKKLGLFENLPKKMIYEWASWGKQKEYMMHFKNKHYHFDQIKLPILAWSFPKDTFAPKAAVDWLAKQYTNAQVTRIHYPSENKKQPGHFGFFKPPFKELLWKQNVNWILTNSLE